MSTPYYADDSVTLHHGDALEVLRGLPDAAVDAVVTDPPYGLEFMGKEWDAFKERPANASGPQTDSWGTATNQSGAYAATLPRFTGKQGASLKPFQDWCETWAAECLRVLKPGGHMLAFGGTRTWHRLACAIEDAGFEIRDSIAWLFASGFPKSLDVSKAIDKLDAADARLQRARRFQAWMRNYLTPQQVNEATGTEMGHHYTTHPTQPSVATVAHLELLRPLLPVEVPEWVEQMCRERSVESENFKIVNLTTAHTFEAQPWQGWGTALKPAHEPVVVARKPLVGTVAANVLEHGTGALNVDGCRIDMGDEVVRTTRNTALGVMNDDGWQPKPAAFESHTRGRWPANVILDENQAAELDQQSGTLTSGANPTRRGSDKFRDAYGEFAGQETCEAARGANSGGASRFFYVAKADASERPRINGTAHPTVKPLALMQHLIRLVTPPGGTVLEPFAGSGTTVEACVIEGVRCIAIEREAEYLPLITHRINRRRNPVEAVRDTGEDNGLFDLLGEAL